MKKTQFSALLVILLSYGTLSYSQTKPAASEAEIKQQLGSYRTKIDSLDALLISTLGQREKVVKEIGIYKAENHIPALQKDRFKQVLERSIEAGKKEGLSATCIEEIMNAIHKESLRIEQEDIAKKQ
ncbi:chorismate mutase [Chitinophaga sp. CF118]|uniref:chorismate mutase n=1 Tax=Chitinophaga sp. CF118 TaxID=1884367 RepID=UPI0008EA94E0|nr:chorismate mutase [Chitinophaga sp. CF118]SFD55480.1 chorismate mutase [Chitinophaga sp. CF118]